MLAVGYTETEETWIQHQFGQFQEQYMSVFPTSDYFKSLFHLLLWGTPVFRRELAQYGHREKQKSA